MPQQTVGVGIIGATGYIGSAYRRELRDCSNARIVAIAARREGLLEEAKLLDDAQLATNDWQAVIEHRSVDLVIVATPDAFHREAVLHCAKNGKHIFCEKPLGINLAEAQEIALAYEKSGLFEFVPFWTRYAPPLVKAKQIVQSGRLGEIRAMVYRWHNPRPANVPMTWRDNALISGGGSLADVGSHAYDTIRWLTGYDAKSVLVHSEISTSQRMSLGEINLSEALSTESPAGNKYSKVTAPDYGNIAVRFNNETCGAVMVSHATFLRKGLCPELELHGSAASLAVNRVSGEISIAEGQQKLVQLDCIPDAPCNRFETHVLPALCSHNSSGQQSMHPNLNDGVQVQRFIDSSLESAESGRWVELAQEMRAEE